MKAPRIPEFDPSTRILLGPGPGMPHPRVMRALTAPTLGHLDPELLELYEQEQELLRYVFQTANPWTFALSGTGTAGMEASLANLLEPGDEVLACIHGYFGARLAEIAGRLGANVDRLERPLGEIFEAEEIHAALRKKTYKLMTVVHAETSTGAEQLQIKEIAAAAHRNGALIVLDTVTSLGGIPVRVDDWGIDLAYSASQKNLGAPFWTRPHHSRSQGTGGNRGKKAAHYLVLSGPQAILELLGRRAWLSSHGVLRTAFRPARRTAA